MHVHILGICGTLMGSIAMLARDLGYRVTGSDMNVYPPMSTQLENAGIELTSPYSAENLPDDVDLFVIGNAGLARGNPAVEAVLRGTTPYTSGAEWLARYLLASRWVIAVSGTHGKTTTSAMIAWILEYAGLNPGFLIGGVPANFGISSRLGNDPFFVIEADEYDTSYFDRRSKFLHYKPNTLVVNNLEFDHADIFNDLGEIENQFHLLLRSVPDSGLVIHPASDNNVARVIERGCWTPTAAVGSETTYAELQSADGSAFSVVIDGQTEGSVAWYLTGQHNVSNAMAAILAARHAGVPAGTCCDALSLFKSVKRRMEVIYSEGGLSVYDDFAHHPTAIETTLAGLRARVGGEKIIAVIEPASHTMKKGTHAETLQNSAQAADEVYWYQPATVGWDMQQLAAPGHHVESDLEVIIKKVTTDLPGECHIVVMSNGAFGGLHQQLVKHLST